jgi:regulator-associated protein of mTOR
MATTVVDFIVAMLLESPFSRIQGTTVRGPRTSPSTRRNASSTSTSASISRQPSLTNLTPSTLNTPLQPLQRTDSAPQVPTRPSFPGLIRTSSIASAIGTLAGFAMGTQSGENTTPSSPSQSQYSDAELPPAPSFNVAQYVSPYGKSPSPDTSVSSSDTSAAKSNSSTGSTRPSSPIVNGDGHTTGNARTTNKYTPVDVISCLIASDLIRFAQRRGEQTGHFLWKDLSVHRSQLEELEDLGLNAGDHLNQTLPLKSRFYDWCLEYYKEPQMRVCPVSAMR